MEKSADSNKMRNSIGYSLIEVLTVLVIVGLFSGLALAAYNSFSEKKNLENASQKIVDALTQAKIKSASGDASLCNASPPITPAVIDFSIRRTSATAIQLLPNCAAGTAVPKDYTVSSNVTIGNFADITFKNLTAGVQNWGCFEVQSGSNNCRYIQVTNQGAITEGSTPCAGSCP